MSNADARKSFSDLLNETGFGGRRVVVTRKGKAVAAMISIQDFEVIRMKLTDRGFGCGCLYDCTPPV